MSLTAIERRKKTSGLDGINLSSCHVHFHHFLCVRACVWEDYMGNPRPAEPIRPQQKQRWWWPGPRVMRKWSNGRRPAGLRWRRQIGSQFLRKGWGSRGGGLELKYDIPPASPISYAQLCWIQVISHPFIHPYMWIYGVLYCVYVYIGLGNMTNHNIGNFIFRYNDIACLLVIY